MAHGLSVETEDGVEIENQLIRGLRSCSVLGSLERGWIEELAVHTQPRSFHRGDLIYLPGDRASQVFIVASGLVRIKQITPNGAEAILGFHSVGELFGEQVLAGSLRRTDYAEAATSVNLLSIPAPFLQRLCDCEPELWQAIFRLIAERRAQAESRFYNTHFLSGQARLVRLILELVERHSRPAGRGWEILLPLTHKDLAGMVGHSRELVTGILSRLQAEGYIRVRRKRLIVVDLEGLERLGRELF